MMRGLSLLALLFAAECACAQPPDTLWTKLFGAQWRGECLDAQICSDGGFILGGVSFTDAAATHPKLVRIDSEGNVLWMRAYGSSPNDRILAAGQTEDGRYAAGGIGGVSSSMLALRTDEAGDTLWTRRTAVNGSLRHGMITVDDGLLLTGLTVANEGDMFAVRTAASGAVLWQRTYGGAHYDCAYRPSQLADGGFLVPG